MLPQKVSPTTHPFPRLTWGIPIHQGEVYEPAAPKIIHIEISNIRSNEILIRQQHPINHQIRNAIISSIRIGHALENFRISVPLPQIKYPRFLSPTYLFQQSDLFNFSMKTLLVKLLLN